MEKQDQFRANKNVVVEDTDVKPRDHFFFLMIPPPPRSTLFPYTTLFRSSYTVAAQMQDSEDFDVKGWAIRTEECGSWSWWISDGMEQTRYKASPERQPLNDGA